MFISNKKVNQTRKKELMLSLLLLMCTCGLSLVADNIALNKSYTMNVRSKYSLTRNKADATELTDGKYSTGKKFWTCKSTVGWSFLRKPIEILIDLKKKEPIAGISVNMGAGSSEVEWPKNIQVLVSDNKKDYYLVSELISKNRNKIKSGYQVIKFTDNKLNCNGRFVKLRIIPSGKRRYVFIDEIEIMRGSQDLLKLKHQQKKFSAETEQQAWVSKYCKRRFNKDLNLIGQRILKLKSPKAVRKLAAEQKKLENEIKQFHFNGNPQKFEAVMPFDALQEKIYKLNAGYLRTKGYQSLVLWSSHRFDKITPLSLPQANLKKAVGLTMLKGEVAGYVINLTNTMDSPQKISVKLLSLPKGTIKLYNVKAVDTKRIEAENNAFFEIKGINQNYQIDLPSGINTQLWFSVLSQGLKPGKRHSKIVFNSGNGWTKEIDLNINIIDTKSLVKNQLTGSLFSYVAPCLRGVTNQNVTSLINKMRNMGINMPWAAQAIPQSANAVDSAGNYIGKIKTGNLKKMLKIWPGAKYYGIFFNLAPHGVCKNARKFGGLKIGSPKFKRALGQWAKSWGRFIREHKLEGKVVFNLIDEPFYKQNYLDLLDWASVIKKAAPEIMLFIDPCRLKEINEDSERKKMLLKLCRMIDIICINSEIFTTDWIGIFKNHVDKCWFYRCVVPSRNLDLGYYRLQPWMCFESGFTGSLFWGVDSYNVKSDLNEYIYLIGSKETPYNGNVFFLTKNKIYLSKQSEALRDGIQDYMLLMECRKRVNKITDLKQKAKLNKKLMGIVKDLTAKGVAANFDFGKAFPVSPAVLADASREKLIDILQAATK